MLTVAEVAAKFAALREQMNRVIIGQDRVKDQVLVCLLAGGHTLLEGVPGTGKTLLALTLARLLGCEFNRIQFTPDLMPSDIMGTNVFNPKTQEFDFHAGPIFTDFLLADEINRTPPKTQSALLEAMQEKAATIDGIKHNISPVFTVFATQNPVEFEGTYPLPEAQRDRFLLKISIDCPSAAEEITILENYVKGNRLHDIAINDLGVAMMADDLIAARRTAAKLVRVEPALLGYIQKIVAATRSDDAVQIGAGPRASLALLDSGRALAILRGREFVSPDDIKEMALPVLIHRVTLSPEAEMEGTTLGDVLRRLFEKIEVPR
ncbi:MAG TPA: MoxR family ATPase [Planctomycetota bacterium]|nr:MoxR family ATPase [Planctomycetota bacterium]